VIGTGIPPHQAAAGEQQMQKFQQGSSQLTAVSCITETTARIKATGL
jgi:hypothetical protein